MLIKDMAPDVELYQPKDLTGAFALLDRYGAAGWKLAGGHDSLSWFKDRVKRPKALIDLTAIDGLSGIRQTPQGVVIGAMTSLAEIARHPLITSRYRVLAEAASGVASPQIRNTATIGGNVAQHARCWYYRSGQPCFRAGGNWCFARGEDGVNREHALFDTRVCVAASPSDLAPVLAALEAKMVIASAKGRRDVDWSEFFIGPATDVTSLTSLRPQDILVAIELPQRWSGAHFYFEKVADRAVWDFALVSVAAALRMDGDRIEEARIACGAVSALPKRLPAVEEALRGKQRSEETARAAGTLAVEGAKPLRYNGYKVPLMANLVTRAVRDARA